MPLVLDNLSFKRNGVSVFENLSCVLQEGEALLLKGPNGAGKSTLLKIIAGLLTPQAGTIVYDAKNLTYMGHVPGLPHDMTVWHYLNLMKNLHQTISLDVHREHLHIFGITPFFTKPIMALSEGQKKRLRLALLPLMHKNLWLLDEPLSNLDEGAQNLFMQSLEDHLKKGGMTMIASHENLPLQSKVLHLKDFAPC